MNKTAIVMDSSVYTTQDFIDENNIKIVPLSVNFDNVSYSEGVEDLKTVIEIFSRIEEISKLPKTSQPSAQEFISVFDELKAEGYKKIVVFTITSHLSGTYQGTVVAANMYLEENPDMDIRVFDSNNVGPGSALVVREVAKVINEQGDISSDKINDIIQFYAKEVKLFLLVDTLDYLSYGGRISPSIAAIGNLFGIKPLLRIDGGEFKEHAKPRSRKKAYLEIIRQYDEYTKLDESAEYELLSAHANCEKEVKKLVKVLTDSKKDIDVTVAKPIVLGPVISIHVGPDALGVLFVKKYQQ